MESGGVFPQTVLWEFGSLSPARTFVAPPCVKPPPRYKQWLALFSFLFGL